MIEVCDGCGRFSDSGNICSECDADMYAASWEHEDMEAARRDGWASAEERTGLPAGMLAEIEP